MKMTETRRSLMLAKKCPTSPTDMGRSDQANISSQAPKNMHYALKSPNTDIGCINFV